MIDLEIAKGYRNKIMELINDGCFEESLKGLSKFHDHFRHFLGDKDSSYVKEVIVLIGRYKVNENDRLKNVINYEDYRIDRTQTMFATLNYADVFYRRLEQEKEQDILAEKTKIRTFINSNTELRNLKIQKKLNDDDQTISEVAEEIYLISEEQNKLDFIHSFFTIPLKEKTIDEEESQPIDKVQTLQTIRDKNKKPKKNSLVFQGAKIRKIYPKTLESLFRTKLFQNQEINEFELNVPEITLRFGEIVGLVGENATGKSTLLNIIAGSLSLSSGSIQYPQFNAQGKIFESAAIRNQLAYVPQHLTEWQGSLIENISFEAARHGLRGQKNHEAVIRIINLLGLGKYVHKNWRELSGGYRLRYELARALVWKPKLLILDEPLAHLDVHAQITVLDDLKDLVTNQRNEIAILISSQHIHELEFVADQVLFMRKGKVIEEDQDVEERAHYEISCSENKEILKAALAAFPDIQVDDKIMYLHISTPVEMSQQALLNILKKQNISIQYFRNISQSVKTKFYESREK